LRSNIFASYVIPTIGRPSLDQSIISILTQRFPEAEFEVIVVNDSGKELGKAEWQSSTRVQTINTNQCERSFARNTGAAIAKGRFLAFVDDDDWILPDSLSYFWNLVQQKQAAMYYGGYRFVDPTGNTLNEYYPDESGNCFIRFMAGEWQPLQATLIEINAFRAVGGFLPLNILRGGDEDVDLLRRISLKHDIEGVRELIATIRIDRSGSTTNYANLQEQSRQSRDLILNAADAFSRLHRSALDRRGSSAYWHGRLVWIYLGSVGWNFRQRKIFTAFSRLAYATLGLFASFRYWLTLKFWHGATRPHHAEGWLAVE